MKPIKGRPNELGGFIKNFYLKKLDKLFIKINN